MYAAWIDNSLASNAVANGLAPFAAKRPKKLRHSGHLFTLAFPLPADGSVVDCPAADTMGPSRIKHVPPTPWHSSIAMLYVSRMAGDSNTRAHAPVFT